MMTLASALADYLIPALIGGMTGLAIVHGFLWGSR